MSCPPFLAAVGKTCFGFAHPTRLADLHFVHQVLEECNIKDLTLIDSEAAYVSKLLKINFKSMGPKFGKQMNEIAKQVQQMEL